MVSTKEMKANVFKAKNRHKRNGQGGFTLTEIAIVLGIIGLILAAIWVAASGVYTNQKSAKGNTELLTITQGVRSLFATQTQVDSAAAGADETTSIVRSGLFPTDMLDTGNPYTATTVRGPWTGSTVKLFNSTVISLGDSYEVTFMSVPQSACINLLTASTGAGRDQGMEMATAVAAAGTYVPFVATTFPVAPSTAMGLCTGSTNDVAFVFYLH